MARVQWGAYGKHSTDEAVVIGVDSMQGLSCQEGRKGGVEGLGRAEDGLGRASRA